MFAHSGSSEGLGYRQQRDWAALCVEAADALTDLAARAEQAETRLAQMSGLLDAKYLNPECGLNGCQFLQRRDGREESTP